MLILQFGICSPVVAESALHYTGWAALNVLAQGPPWDQLLTTVNCVDALDECFGACIFFMFSRLAAVQRESAAIFALFSGAMRTLGAVRLYTTLAVLMIHIFSGLKEINRRCSKSVYNSLFTIGRSYTTLSQYTGREKSIPFFYRTLFLSYPFPIVPFSYRTLFLSYPFPIISTFKK